MAYGLKYTIEYKRLSNNTTKIEIYQKDYTDASIELTPTDDPLEISFNGNANNIYTPTNGWGATIRVLSEPLQLAELFTEDPQEFIVKIYNDTTMIWAGYVSSDTYSEDYSIISPLKTQIEIQCNDGMALLDNIPYCSSVGVNYTGFTSFAGVLNTILGKLENKFTELISSTDLMVTSTGYTNLFLGLTVNNENYQDEQSIPKSCREVLNSILQGLGLVMEFLGDKIYVYDPVCLSRPTLAKKYTLYSAYTFTETSTTLGGYKNIGTDLPWYKTGQNLDIVKPFNQIQVKYDPYTITELSYDFDENINQPDPSTIQWVTGYTGDYRYSSNLLPMSGWTTYGATGFHAAAQITNNESIEDVVGPSTFFYQMKYISYTNPNYSLKTVTYEFPVSSVKQDDNLLLELSMNVYVNTKNQYNIFTPTEEGTEISSCYLGPFELKIGNKWYEPVLGKWVSYPTTFSILVRQSDADYRTVRRDVKISQFLWWKKYKTYYVRNDDSRINDTWTTVMLTVPLSELACSNVSLLSGLISLRMYERSFAASCLDGDSQIIYPYEPLGYLINNIGVRFLNTNKTPITDKGISKLATISETTYIKKSDLNVTLNNGTGLYGSSKSAYSSDAITPIGTNITGLYRTGNTICYDTAELVCQNLLSQYKTTRKKLSASLSVESDLLSNRFKLIRDTHLLGKDFYIVSGSYDDRDEALNCSLLEVASSLEELPGTSPTPTPSPSVSPGSVSQIYYKEIKNSTGRLGVTNPMGKTFAIEFSYQIDAYVDNAWSQNDPNQTYTKLYITTDEGNNWIEVAEAFASIPGGSEDMDSDVVTGTTIVTGITNVEWVWVDVDYGCSYTQDARSGGGSIAIVGVTGDTGTNVIVCNNQFNKGCTSTLYLDCYGLTPSPSPSISITPSPTPSISVSPSAVTYLGFDYDGNIDFSVLGDTVINITITGTTTAYQSWINCDSVPIGECDVSYGIETQYLYLNATESSANINDKDTSTTYNNSRTFSYVHSGSTSTLYSFINNQSNYCGDCYGDARLEITDITIVAGTKNIQIDPNNNTYDISQMMV